MKLAIISTGLPKDTKIIDIETEKEVEGVTNIKWSIGVGGISKATVKLINIPIFASGLETIQKEENRTVQKIFEEIAAA